MINALAVTTDGGKRSVDLAVVQAFNTLPICQIVALRDDPRGQVTTFAEAIAMAKERKAAREKAKTNGR